MEKTGGYVGTDMDAELLEKEDDEQIDISDQIASLHGDSNLIMTKTLLESRLNLKALRTKRRALREKLLCSTNCQFQEWSYLQGIKLSEQCPMDCPIKQDLEGRLIGRTSVEAMDKYQGHSSIRSVDKNTELLKEADKEIGKIQKFVGDSHELTLIEETSEAKESKKKSSKKKKSKKAKHKHKHKHHKKHKETKHKTSK